MDAKELRIGNFINAIGLHASRVVTVEQIGAKGTMQEEMRVISFKEHHVGEFARDCEGIPLSEEWLEKFEFQLSEDLGDQKYYQIIPQDEGKGYGVCHDHEEWTFYSYDGNVVKTLIYDESQFQFVHQLQNLYFALTGTELVINQAGPRP